MNRSKTVVSFTATYTGQAVSGEWVEVSGVLEQTEQGRQTYRGWRQS